MNTHVDTIDLCVSRLAIYVPPRRRRPFRSTVSVIDTVPPPNDAARWGVETVRSRSFVFMDRSRSLGGTNEVLEVDGTIYVMTKRTHAELTRRLDVLTVLDRRLGEAEPDRGRVVATIMSDRGLRDLAVSIECALGDLVAWRKLRGSFSDWIGRRFARTRLAVN